MKDIGLGLELQGKGWDKGSMLKNMGSGLVTWGSGWDIGLGYGCWGKIGGYS